MFHVVIHKITLAQFFLRHGVFSSPWTHSWFSHLLRDQARKYITAILMKNTAIWAQTALSVDKIFTTLCLQLEGANVRLQWVVHDPCTSYPSYSLLDHIQDASCHNVQIKTYCIENQISFNTYRKQVTSLTELVQLTFTITQSYQKQKTQVILNPSIFKVISRIFPGH